jgi:hypothetical protein
MSTKLIAALVGSLFALGALSGSVFAEDKKETDKKEQTDKK